MALKRTLGLAAGLSACVLATGALAGGHGKLDASATSSHDAMLKKIINNGITVSTTPYLGLRNGNILYRVSVMNEDLLLLQQRYRLQKELEKMGASLKKRAIIGLSGALEASITEHSNYRSGSYGGVRLASAEGSVNLSTAEIDVGMNAGEWVGGFMSLTYDSSSTVTGSRVPSSTVYLQRGFLTFGNLEKTPFYFSAGKMYTPFGIYKSAMINYPLTETFGRISSKAAVLGYSDGPFYAQIYGYNSLDTNARKSWPMDEGGINVGYQQGGDQGFGVNVGAVSNIADSEGAQTNGSIYTGFTGFGSSSSRDLVKNVPGGAFAASYHMGGWTFEAEFITALRKYNALDMQYNGRSAHPTATHVEADYTMNLFGGRATTFTVAYGQTREAFAMNLPKESYTVQMDVAVWKRAAVGLEIDHQINYKDGTTGTGYGQTFDGPTGKSRNVFTLRMGVYF